MHKMPLCARAEFRGSAAHTDSDTTQGLRIALRTEERTVAKKENRMQVILECTEAPGTSRYHTFKNVRNTTGRLELKKYNARLRKHTVHREKK